LDDFAAILRVRERIEDEDMIVVVYCWRRDERRM
jgi:hypothetical protein